MPVQYEYGYDDLYPLLNDIRIVTQLANATSQTLLSHKTRAPTTHKMIGAPLWLAKAWNEARSNARVSEHLQLVRLIPLKFGDFRGMEQIANAIF